MATLEKLSQDACASALKQYGYTLKRRGILLQPSIDESVTGWLGLNLATWDLPAKMEINPVVGVRHVQLERALVELAGWPRPVSSVSKPLGYLMPQNTFVQWEFSSGGDVESVAADLAEAVHAYGQPFIDKWSDWKTFSTEISDSTLLLDNQKFFILPLVAVINNDRASAKSWLEQELGRIEDKSDVYANSYREFAHKVGDRYL
ncbi:hypothetical protein [Micromonospora violae]|uniref:hypothetical protein n=1 Tax=Micromonospora violae TaxID=1278207 RepID=UPI0033F8B818